MVGIIAYGAYRGGKYAYRRLKARRKCSTKKGKSRKACIRKEMKK